ncbi:MAG TPA: hypothetical protein VGF61_25355 [Candidatus Acidoferrum sp.]
MDRLPVAPGFQTLVRSRTPPAILINAPTMGYLEKVPHSRQVATARVRR